VTYPNSFDQLFVTGKYCTVLQIRLKTVTDIFKHVWMSVQWQCCHGPTVCFWASYAMDEEPKCNGSTV